MQVKCYCGKTYTITDEQVARREQFTLDLEAGNIPSFLPSSCPDCTAEMMKDYPTDEEVIANWHSPQTTFKEWTVSH